MPESVKCPRCGTEIGKVIEIDGVQVLRIGGIVTRFAHGVCATCGGEIHWSIADAALEWLLRRYCNQVKDVLS